MKCLSCGEYITSNKIFCSACGKINILCPNCKKLVSGEEVICDNCGFDLTSAIERAKKLEDERESQKKENIREALVTKKIQSLDPEMRKYASNLIVDCEGNKFKAIKEFKDKYQVENSIASKYISDAYDEINGLTNNNFNESTTNNDIFKNSNYVVPRGIKKTIIVSQSSRKKASSAIGRGLIGGAILGPIGLLASASAKSTETTTFQIIYNNGQQETVTVKNDSKQFEQYCKYLNN